MYVEAKDDGALGDSAERGLRSIASTIRMIPGYVSMSSCTIFSFRLCMKHNTITILLNPPYHHLYLPPNNCSRLRIRAIHTCRMVPGDAFNKHSLTSTPPSHSPETTPPGAHQTAPNLRTHNAKFLFSANKRSFNFINKRKKVSFRSPPPSNNGLVGVLHMHQNQPDSLSHFVPFMPLF
jgi:hypothetical protein